MKAPTRLQLAFASGLAAVGLGLAALAADVAPTQQAPAPAAPAPAVAPAAPAAQAPGVALPLPQNVAQANKPSVTTRAPARAAQLRSAAPRPESSPTWGELTPQQQQSLAPLAGTWRVLGEAHKRKWLALSHNYPSMPPGEQARLHSRMAEWAALSPQQRTLARMNFVESQRLNASDKRAKWEAYQNLSPEEKRKLAAGAAAPKPPPTAIAVKPQQRLARITKPRKPEANTAKLTVLPGQVDNNTLLPQPLAPIQP